MSKETTVNRATRIEPHLTLVLAAMGRALLNRPHGVLRFTKAALHNAPTNCLSNGDGKKAGP